MIRRRHLVALVSVGVVLGCLAIAATADAAIGDIFVLDIARPDSLSPSPSPRVIKVDPSTSAQSQIPLTPSPLPPDPLAPELPLHFPVGIDVDQISPNAGTLLVIDAGGYPGVLDKSSTDCATIDPNDRGSGCGALLRVNPANGQTTVVSGPPVVGVNNKWEDPYDVLVRPPEGAFTGDYLVSDPGSGRIIKVNPTNGAQTVFNQGPGYPIFPIGSGLRAPWGIAQDPSPGPNHGDILVANTSCASCPFDPSELPAGFVVPSECQNVGTRGYIMRLSPTGVPKTMYCSDNFLRPRGIAVDSAGTIFVTDPITFAFNPGVGFGTVFAIDPASRSVNPVSAGGSMATPSGLDFDSNGISLLLADETLFPFAPPCMGDMGLTTGCGGLLKVNPDGGAQAVVSSGGFYVDPIDVTVDRGTLAPPTLPIRTVPRFLDNLGRDEGKVQATGVIPLLPVRGGSTISVKCLDPECAGLPPQTFSVPADQSVYPLTIQDFVYTVYTCPKNRKLKGKWCVLKKKRKRKRKSRKRGARAAVCKKAAKRCPGHPTQNPKKAESAQIAVTGPGLPYGQYVNVTLSGASVSAGQPVCFNSQQVPFSCPQP